MRIDTPPDLLQLAIQHFNGGELTQAESLCRKLLKRQKGNPDAWHLLGVIAMRMGQTENAVAHIRTCTRLAPGNAAALCNLGLAYKAQGRLSQAAAVLEQASRAAPDNSEILYNLGNTRASLGEFEAAIAAYHRAVALNPDQPEYHNNLGRALEGDRSIGEAIAAYARALALQPSFAGALTNLGNAYLDLGRPADALRCHRQAIAHQPDFDAAHSNLIFALNFDPAAGPDDHARARAQFGERHRTRISAGAVARPCDPDRRLRIGYVSGHFRHQAATYAFAPVIIHHDRRAFDVICYSDTAPEDGLTHKLRDSVKTWRATAALSDAELAASIEADKIDILVDLVGHMVGNRLGVFARKPAPVQVSGWGEPTGTGLSTMDYLFGDPVLVPDHVRPLLREQVIDLPCFLCFWTPENLPDPGPPPALNAGHVTFGSFNRPAKLSDPVLQLWARILRAAPTSRLVLKSPHLSDLAIQQRINAIFDSEGISRDRLTILGNSDRGSHMKAYQLVDVALDPFPHGGGMTTLDAMAMGVPVITCPGPTISSRLAAACITALGLTDCVAASQEEYVALALRMTADLDGLARLRHALRDRLVRSPIGDAHAYARSVEAAYRGMWQRYCEDRNEAGAVRSPPA
ncbi:O-linked N-acetylglucosamine transferase family protein [Bradyrhizobium commune]|uniref:protein O-GlcNAc transferase n=1 Tax=Bradyrhizobium commune TaxID=83627 RepID=A0A7S9D7F6_9BRAD|nr:tetratricopeptide repeat protein [Bradyrhizobium commune]QPF91834.1 tetratricopeptide repeat protein [Bradyrhizobium commune]